MDNLKDLFVGLMENESVFIVMIWRQLVFWLFFSWVWLISFVVLSLCKYYFVFCVLRMLIKIHIDIKAASSVSIKVLWRSSFQGLRGLEVNMFTAFELMFQTNAVRHQNITNLKYKYVKLKQLFKGQSDS